MACDSPVRECFEWHIKPRLDKPRPNAEGSGVRALCPVHDDRNQSLSISIGDKQRVTWQCFAGCSRTRIRAVLISRGVSAGCLPLVTKEKEDLLEMLRSILTADSADHGGIRLRAVAALEGYEDLPRGGELDRIAGLAGVNRATAYRARKSPLPQAKPNNPSSYSLPAEPVKSRRSQAPGKVA